MARFLLGTQLFIDLAATEESKPRNWLFRGYETRGIIPTDIAISSATLVTLHLHFAELQANGKMTAKAIVMQQRCALYEQEYHDPGNILPIDDDTIRVWKNFAHLELQYVRRDGTTFTMGRDEKLLIATAISKHLTLLDRRQPAHEVLASFGLVVEDPYEP